MLENQNDKNINTEHEHIIYKKKLEQLNKEALLKQLTLKPHSYPAGVKFLGYLSGMLYIAVCINFFSYHLSNHCQIAYMQDQALRFLTQKDYVQANSLYKQLSHKIPYNKFIQIQLLKINFALATDLESSMSVLRQINISLTLTEYDSIQKYIAKEYLEIFKSSFTWKISRKK